MAKILEHIRRNRFVPMSATIELTYRCNFRCGFCYCAKEKREELETKNIFKVLDELADLSCFLISFCGGEVFLRPDFFEIAEHAKKRGLGIIIYSNASLIDKNNIGRIKSLNPIRIIIGFYGATNKTYTKTTKNPQARTKVMHGIKLLNNHDIPFKLGGMLSKDTYCELEKMANITQKICGTKKSLRFYTGAMPRLDRSYQPLDYELSAKDKKILLSDKILKNYISLKHIKDKKIACEPGISTINISPYGDVFPCTYLRISCGNIRKQSFARIWRDSKILSDLRTTLLQKSNICSTCKIDHSYCQFCPAYMFLQKDMIKKSLCLNFMNS